MRFSTQAHVVALIIALVVLGLRGRTVLEHRIWAAGSATVKGHVDDIQASRKVRVIRYSYSVDGKNYNGEVTDMTRFTAGLPATVTYAVADPSVSTILPAQIGSGYAVSLVLCILALLPVAVMWVLEIGNRLTKSTPEGAQ